MYFAVMCSVKTLKNAQTFSEFEFGTWKFSPEISARFFFSDGFPFSWISWISEIGPNFFEIYTDHWKWHITLRFNENPKPLGFLGHSCDVVPAKARNVEVCVTGNIETSQNYDGTRGCAAGFWKNSRFSEITRTVSREFPWHTVLKKSWGFHPVAKKARAQ
jgi:hypothetical protein